MNKLLLHITVIYLILIYASPIFQRVPGIALLREGYIMMLLFLCFINISKLRVNKLNLLLIMYICSNIVSFFLSPNKADAISCFICYISGPLIFFCLSNIVISKELFFTIRKNITYMLCSIIILSLIIYPIQEQVYAFFGFTKGMKGFLFSALYRYEKGHATKMRLSGLCLHPTTMGYVCILYLIFKVLLSKKKHSLWVVIPYYLTDTRSVIFGIPFAFYSKLKRKHRVFIFLTIIPPIFAGVVYFAANLSSIHLDDSAFAHFMDLFFFGPQLVMHNLTPFGYGHATMSPYFPHGNFIHVESELYIACIQIGVIGVGIYLLILKELYKTLMVSNDIEANYCLYVLFIFNIGCLFLALYAVRFISNYMWIELGLYFSYRRTLCRK